MKKQQRSKAKAECASSAERNITWKSIDFSKCERKVRKLQIRIAKAQKEKRYNKVKALQHLLVTSNQLKRWSYRRHTKKSREWIRRKYFIHEGSRKWIFGLEYVCGGIKERFTLDKLAEIPIKRHIKIKCEANPFDPLWDEYFERRKLKSARLRA